jgi:hypothetical protein
MKAAAAAMERADVEAAAMTAEALSRHDLAIQEHATAVTKHPDTIWMIDGRANLFDRLSTLGRKRRRRRRRLC